MYDCSLEAFGHEPLFRARDVDVAEISDGGAATAQFILSTFINIRVGQIVWLSMSIQLALLDRDGEAGQRADACAAALFA